MKYFENPYFWMGTGHELKLNLVTARCVRVAVSVARHTFTQLFILFMESTQMTCRDQLLIVDAV